MMGFWTKGRARIVERMAEKRKSYRALVGKSERRSLLRRCRSKRKYNIKVGLKEIDGRVWTGLM
jgi:hypothetical protein